MKFTREINQSISYLIKNEGYKRSEAVKFAFELHRPIVNQVRQRLEIGDMFVFHFKKKDRTETMRKAISISEAIERGLYTPVEMTEEKRAEQAKRRDNIFPAGYVKFFDMDSLEVRMACAENVIKCTEIGQD